jgi:UDP-N-acetylglucosamine 4,6-dehydratase
MRYLVTGGTGSFGSRFVERVITDGHEAIVFSRDELKQYEMRKRITGAEYVIGDVRDNAALEETISRRRCNRVVHAAALKHVHTGETQPWESVKTNIIGTKNVVDVCDDWGCELVFLSTDKAVEPVNLYGATKMIAERIILDAGQRVVRYGNVFGSRGSVLHVFDTQKRDGVFTITDQRMTRFVITLDEAVDFVLNAFEGNTGTVSIPVLRAIRIVDLARAFDPTAEIREIGVQPGEKLAEVLGDGQRSDEAPLLSVDEIRELINETLHDR